MSQIILNYKDHAITLKLDNSAGYWKADDKTWYDLLGPLDSEDVLKEIIYLTKGVV